MTRVDDERRTYWRRRARRYDRVALFLNRRLPLAARVVAEDLRGTDRVLELGAGTGLVTLEIAAAAGHVLATDLSPAMLQLLERRVAEAGLANVETRGMDALDPAVPDASQDAIVMANLLHLLPDPDAAVRVLARKVRHGGLLALPTFLHGEGRRARAVSRLLALARFPIVTRFSLGSLRACAEGAGLAIERADLFPGILPIGAIVARR